MTIRWGIIGCGDVTEVKSGPAFQQAEGSELFSVMRRDGVKCEDYARRHNVPHWTTDADAVIQHPNVDAVYIATPPGSHLEYALKVCAAGKPCYVEKPMARNYAECLQMVEAFEKANVPLFVAYYRRALPRFQKAKEIIANNVLGGLAHVYVTLVTTPDPKLDSANLPWRLQAEHAGGGLFLDLGCHTLDILDYILGPLDKINGKAENRGGKYVVEDFIGMGFTERRGSRSMYICNFEQGTERHDRISFHGSKGCLTLSTFGNEPVHLVLSSTAGEQREEFDLPNPKHIQQPLVQSIVEELHGRGKCPSTGVSAARTSKIIDAVLATYYGGREDAFWTRPETWPGNPFVGVLPTP